MLSVHGGVGQGFFTPSASCMGPEKEQEVADRIGKGFSLHGTCYVKTQDIIRVDIES